MIPQIWPQRELHGPAQQLGELLVITSSSRLPQRIGQLRPLPWPGARVARPPATSHRVRNVLRLRPQRKVIRPDTAPNVAAVPHDRFRQPPMMGKSRPAVTGDHTERLAPEPAVPAIGLDPAQPDPALVTATEVHARREPHPLVPVSVRPVHLQRVAATSITDIEDPDRWV